MISSYVYGITICLKNPYGLSKSYHWVATKQSRTYIYMFTQRNVNFKKQTMISITTNRKWMSVWHCWGYVININWEIFCIVCKHGVTAELVSLERWRNRSMWNKRSPWSFRRTYCGWETVCIFISLYNKNSHFRPKRKCEFFFFFWTEVWIFISRSYYS